MGFRLVILLNADPSDMSSMAETWPDRLRALIPDIDVRLCRNVDEAEEVIAEADAAYGNIVPDLFRQARNLKWIASPQAGPRAGYYHKALIESDVVVTNARGIFGDHIGAHIMSFVTAFARGLHVYIPRQKQAYWDASVPTVYLPEATAVIVGVGGIGSETARLCSAFGMTVLGVDPRRAEPPAGVAELHRPEGMDRVLPRGDFVIVTAPETPETQGLFTLDRFRLMKPSAFFINIGRGATVILDDLVLALRTGEIAGAGLDVYETEPLPSSHPLWTLPNVILTPHVAAAGPYVDDRRTELFIDNCLRFNEGRALRNVVDKAHWY